MPLADATEAGRVTNLWTVRCYRVASMMTGYRYRHGEETNASHSTGAHRLALGGRGLR